MLVPHCQICTEPIQGEPYRVARGLRAKRARIICAFCFDHYTPKYRCEICERPYASFTPVWRKSVRTRHHFCSLDCERVHEAGRERPRKFQFTTTCQGCGRSFKPRRQDEKYCPATRAACRQRAYRRRSAERDAGRGGGAAADPTSGLAPATDAA